MTYIGYPQSQTETIKNKSGAFELPALPNKIPHISFTGGNQLDLRFFSVCSSATISPCLCPCANIKGVLSFLSKGSNSMSL